MGEPLYAEDLRFKALREICKMAGYEVMFEDDVENNFIKEGRYAYTQVTGNTLHLPNDDNFFEESNSFNDECVALGHELGHHILTESGFYDIFYDKDNEEFSNLIEVECDKIGIILSQLANLVVKKDNEKVMFDFVREKQCCVHSSFMLGERKRCSLTKGADVDYTILKHDDDIALIEEFWNGEVYTNGISVKDNEYTNNIYEPVYYDSIKKEIILGFGEIKM